MGATDKFLRTKVKRLIASSGVEVRFIRYVTNKYDEPTEEIEFETTIKTVFHTTKSYVKQTIGDSSKTITKQQPMLLALYEDTLELSNGDNAYFNGKHYTISGITNVNELNSACDISLEESL